MNLGPVLVEARRLTKTFGSTVVLDELDFAVSAGEAVAVVGANGSGKTTLLRCLASLVTPSSGEVFWFGRLPRDEPLARRGIGVLGHESGLYPHLTVNENLLVAARMSDVSEPRVRVSELLAAAELGPAAGRQVGRLSRGMRQRVAILRAIVHDPRVLLLDEPTSGLDADGTDWLVGLLQDRRERSCASCIATHDDQLVESVADRAIELVASRSVTSNVNLRRQRALEKAGDQFRRRLKLDAPDRVVSTCAT